jgi:hypothetical protein
VHAYRACVASLLELELEQVPQFEGMAAGLEFDAWLARELQMVRVTMLQFSPPPMLWIARVHSPYLTYDTHSLVMQQWATLFDPHPEAQPIDVQEELVLVELFCPMDPAQPSGRAALES